MLSVRSAKGTRYRHVVFSGSRGAGRVLNLAPVESRPTSIVEESSSRAPRVASERLSPGEEEFISWLFAEAGLEARVYRRETFRRRLGACLRALSVSTPAEARDMLKRRPALIPAAVNAIVIGVTSFFRDPAVFDQLTYHALSMLALNASNNPPRVWSIGCSSGEELYSVAILLAEMGIASQSTLLGTDCRSGAIRQAREGIYEASALKNVPSEWMRNYFIASTTGPRGTTRYQLCNTLRRQIQWRTADTTRVLEPGQWDLILCRNTAMYFRSDVSGQLWEQLENVLRPGGYLVLGKAERPAGARLLSCVAPCIYRRTLG